MGLGWCAWVGGYIPPFPAKTHTKKVGFGVLKGKGGDVDGCADSAACPSHKRLPELFPNPGFRAYGPVFRGLGFRVTVQGLGLRLN